MKSSRRLGPCLTDLMSMALSGSGLLRTAPFWFLPGAHTLLKFLVKKKKKSHCSLTLWDFSFAWLCIWLGMSVALLLDQCGAPGREVWFARLLFLCAQAPWVATVPVLMELHRITLTGECDLVG